MTKAKAKSAEDEFNDTLPQWNFENFYPHPDSPEFEADFQRLEKMIDDFAAKYEGKISELDGEGMLEMLAEDKVIDDLEGKTFGYLSLKNTQNFEIFGPFQKKFSELIAPTYSKLTFYSHELKALSEEQMNALYSQAPGLEQQRPMFDKLRTYIPHTMDEKVEKYAGELSPMRGMINGYDERMIELRFPFEGEQLSQTKILDIIAFDPDQTRRAKANRSFQKVMKDNMWFTTMVHNELIRQKKIDDRWEKFENAPDARHLSNGVKPEVVNALETAVKDSYPRIPHRFYAFKAKLMGQRKLNIYDRNVNIFKDADETKIPWEEAKKIVLDAFREFSPVMADTAQKFFDDGWIDAKLGPNKDSGAYASPAAAALVNPMVMTNYQGTINDVTTLAHELGHGVHQYLAAHKGDAIVSTPLTMAETASVSGEMMVFKALLKRAETPEEKRKLVFEKVNAMINTVHRQISFYDFEKKNHEFVRKEGKPLEKGDLCKHWLDSQKDALGPAFNIRDSYGPVFGYVPHLIHTPFYVYAYSFGDALTNALYQVYEEGSVPNFEDKFIQMLEAGGTITPADLKDMFGLDVEDPAFWNRGLQVIEDLLDELEELDRQCNAQPVNDNDAAPSAEM